MQVFIPISDDMFDQLDPAEGMVPYQVGSLLFSQLRQAPTREDDSVSRDKAPEHHPAAHPTQLPCRR